MSVAVPDQRQPGSGANGDALCISLYCMLSTTIKQTHRTVFLHVSS